MQHILQHICSSQHANQGSFYIILPLWLARNQVTEGPFFSAQHAPYHHQTIPFWVGYLQLQWKIHRKSIKNPYLFNEKTTKKADVALPLPGWTVVGTPGRNCEMAKSAEFTACRPSRPEMPTPTCRSAMSCDDLAVTGRFPPQKKGYYLVVLVFHPSL